MKCQSCLLAWLRGAVALYCLWLAAWPSLAAADYRYRTFNFPGAQSTRATGINARGDIVGSYVDAGGVSHGFLLRKRVFMTIDVPDAVQTLAARDINARGDIVGNFIDSSGPHGFLLSDARFTVIHFPTSVETLVTGINNAGDVTGQFLNTAGQFRGFILWEGRYRGLKVPGTVDSQGYSTQDNGRVTAGQAQTADGGIHGFVIHGPGEVELIDFPGLAFPCTGARGINQRGDVVGGFGETVCDAGALLGYVLRDGRFTRLEVPDAIATQAFDINDDGVIVGRVTKASGAERAFTATPGD